MTSWADLLDEESEQVLPWFGPRMIHSSERAWVIRGPLPTEHGWHLFQAGGGRNATLKNNIPLPINQLWAADQKAFQGYILGNRFISDQYWIGSSPSKLADVSKQVYCTELGLDRFARATVVEDRVGNLIYFGQEFSEGSDEAVLHAFQDRKENVDHIPNVSPALNLAFCWLSQQRKQIEDRRRELDLLREEEEKQRKADEQMAKLMKDAGTAVGRRAIASKDFETAAKEALRVSGAELLDVRNSRSRNEKIVQYRFRDRRLECLVEKDTLRVISSGVCLTDEGTGEKGDRLFNLESLPGVIGEAIDLGVLVVWGVT